MPSVLGAFIHKTLIPSATRFHGGSYSHRLKKLEKWNRRVLCVVAFVQPNPRTSPVSQGICCELVACSNFCAKANTDHNQVASCNMKKTLGVSSENLIISPVDEKQSVVIPVAELDDGESMDCNVFSGQISVPNAASDQNDTHISNEISMCKEFSQSLSLDAEVQKSLSKSKTFPESREVQTYSSSTNGRADSPGAANQTQNSSASGTSAYPRSISLPSSSTLVSAMKGGRALNGTMMRLDLHVKWAPEVYDPPATSMSHTVTGHQRPKAKKKDRHKRKGKSSQGNGSERKHGNRRSPNKTPDSQNVRLQGNGGRNGFGKSKVVDFFDYSVSSQEVKCGTSFLREALPKVHLPIGEAS